MKLLGLLLFTLLSTNSFASGWIQKADFGGEARHRMVMLTVGNRLYTGLGHYNGAGINVLFDDWWEYDPSTNAWTQKADYLGGICYHPAGFTIGDYAYVGTGRTDPNANILVTSFYRYDPVTNTWIQRASVPGVARRGAVGFEINGYGYLGTGQTTSGNTSTFYRYAPATDSWMQIANFPGAARNSAVGFSIGAYGYVGTGNSNMGSTKDFWRYNPVSNSWDQMADVGPTNRQEAVGFELNGKGYIGTGDDFSSGNNFGDMWEYDVVSNTWTQVEDFAGTPRRYLTACTYQGVAYAGLGTNGTNFKDFWMYDQYLSVLEKNLDEIQVKVYPNPAVDHITIDFGNLSVEVRNTLFVSIIDLTGSVQSEVAVDAQKIQMTTQNLKSGLYLYAIRYKEHVLLSDQFVMR